MRTTNNAKTYKHTWVNRENCPILHGKSLHGGYKIDPTTRISEN